ncbi:MAG: TolC family protein [Bacteroides sp.]|nr:TolC family protein [Bacteroides sp.]
MNYLCKLAGTLCVSLLSGGVCAYSQTVVSLEDLFESAEHNSLQLRPDISAQAEAEQEISVARSALLPEIEASLSASYIGDGFTTRRNFTDYQRAPIPHLGTGVSVGVTQPIYTGGALTTSIEMARLKTLASRQSTELSRNNLRLELTRYYFDLYKHHNLRGVVESSIASAEEVLAHIKARYDQGAALRNDITRYELLIADLNLELVRIDNTIDILNYNLVRLAGLPEGLRIAPDQRLLSQALPTEGEQWWQQEADLNSPSLKLARSGVAISRKAESMVLSERRPKIGLQAGWTLDGPILVEVPPINRNLSYWYVGVGVKYNLSSLYKNNRSLKRSRLATIKADDELRAASERVNLDVRSAHIQYLEAFEVLKSREKSVELADRNYDNISTRYDEGMALVTEMLDAADSRLRARTNLVNARIDIIYNYYKLLFASGKI